MLTVSLNVRKSDRTALAGELRGASGLERPGLPSSVTVGYPDVFQRTKTSRSTLPLLRVYLHEELESAIRSQVVTQDT